MSKITVTFDNLTDVIKEEVMKAVNPSDTGLEDRVATLEEKVNDLDKYDLDNNEVEEEVSALENRITKLEETEVREHVGDLERDLDELSSSVRDIERDLDELRSDVEDENCSMGRDIESLEDDIGEVKGSVEELEDRVNNIDDVVADIAKAYLDEHLNGIIQEYLAQNFDITEYKFDIMEIVKKYMSEHLSVRTEWV